VGRTHLSESKPPPRNYISPRKLAFDVHKVSLNTRFQVPVSKT
jgi:hypothetical protein